jgi:hypothetical protein
VPTATPDATPWPVSVVQITGDAATTVSLFWTMLAAFLGCLVAIGAALVVRSMVQR